jgi:AraC family transcriptional regulator, arabinose operon regulatory protein
MERRVAYVIERMKERLHTETSIDALAADVGLSPSRLGFLFRQATGTSPRTYLHMLRMERARVLLESTDLSVGDVMRQVGIFDPSHFSRDFRKAHGLSPRAYRLQLRLAGPPRRYLNGVRFPNGENR